MSNNEWLSSKAYGTQSLMNTKFALQRNGVDDLAVFSTRVTISGLVFGDYTQWCSSLIFFPIDYTKDMVSRELQVANTDTGVQCYELNARDFGGFTLGELYYNPIYNDFRDYEPYTTSKLYLPFYGFVDVKIIDVIGKYIQIRLEVDKGTGQACYTIGVSDTSLSVPYPPYKIGIDDTNTRILSQHIFQLGVTIPLGSANAVNVANNIIGSAVKGVASIAGAYAGAGLGYGTTKSTTTSKQIKTRRNKKTGRQYTFSTLSNEKTTEYDGTNFMKSRGLTEIFETSADMLSKFNVRPTSDQPNNTMINTIGTTSVKLIRTTCNVKAVAEDFNKLYGKPLGEIRNISDLSGYTEISKIRFEGGGFSTATQTEIAMLEELFGDGIIL